MKNIKTISDAVLLETTDQLVAQERELLISVLEHLREIDRRRLFCDLGYRSLFEYAVKRLKYSEDQAGRRIAAMRLVKELPAIEEKIENGSLTLTNLGLAQALFRQEEKSKPFTLEQKTQLLESLANKSKREAEQIVMKNSSEPVLLKPDQVRVLTDTKTEFRFVGERELQDKLDKVKGLLAHSCPDMNLAQLINKLCDIALKQLDPAEKHKAREEKRSAPAPARGESDTGKNPRPSRRGAISSAVRQELWFKAGGCCENCGSQRALQMEHIQPVALGGSDDINNLKLLCRPCNQRAAVKSFGAEKMQRFFGKGHGENKRHG